MRLIDADALLNKKFKYMVHGRDDLLITIKASDIDNAPTIDAVEVVRCKDCKYYKTALCTNEDNHSSFYCADGERKEETE